LLAFHYQPVAPDITQWSLKISTNSYSAFRETTYTLMVINKPHTHSRLSTNHIHTRGYQQTTYTLVVINKPHTHSWLSTNHIHTRGYQQTTYTLVVINKPHTHSWLSTNPSNSVKFSWSKTEAKLDRYEDTFFIGGDRGTSDRYVK